MDMYVLFYYFKKVIDVAINTIFLLAFCCSK